MVPPPGIEPGTHGFSSDALPTELKRRKIYDKCKRTSLTIFSLFKTKVKIDLIQLFLSRRLLTFTNEGVETFQFISLCLIHMKWCRLSELNRILWIFSPAQLPNLLKRHYKATKTTVVHAAFPFKLKTKNPGKLSLTGVLIIDFKKT
jgi:flagellar biosynthesis protein FlhB